MKRLKDAEKERWKQEKEEPASMQIVIKQP